MNTGVAAWLQTDNGRMMSNLCAASASAGAAAPFGNVMRNGASPPDFRDTLLVL
jgi:hypothetical protein